MILIRQVSRIDKGSDHLPQRLVHSEQVEPMIFVNHIMEDRIAALIVP